MKKTLATLLVVALVASLCGVMFVSAAEEVNVAAGKSWTTDADDADAGTSYVGNVTDGTIEPDGKYDTTLWFGADRRKTDDDAFAMIFDLGETYDNLTKVNLHVWPANASGIVIPASIDVYASADGETYTKVGSVSAFEGTGPQWVTVEFAGVAARYVKVDFVSSIEGDTGVFWFVSEIEIINTEKAAEAPSTGATNLVAGKTYTISEQFRMSNVTWGYDESFPISYPDDNYELTDGLIAEAVYSEAGWMGFNQQTPAQAERGYAFVTFDLGAVCDLDSFDYVNLKNKASGIQPAHTVEIYVSNDGENYELAGTKKFESEEFDALADDAAHKISIALDVSARYVQMRAASYGWNFLGEVEILGTAAGNDKPATNKTYENTYVVTEKTNDDGSTEKVASVEVPYGYTWTIDDVDGKIGGEDATICTTQDAYNACNPNWAITLYVEKQADGTYVALRDAIVCPGSAENAGIEVGGDKIAIVIHSASSNPDLDAQYGNWMGKIVAVSVKAGDVFKIADDMTTVYAVVPGEGAPSTGDAGVLVFVVLAVVAVAGVAVVSKAKKAL